MVRSTLTPNLRVPTVQTHNSISGLSLLLALSLLPGYLLLNACTAEFPLQTPQILTTSHEVPSHTLLILSDNYSLKTTPQWWFFSDLRDGVTRWRVCLRHRDPIKSSAKRALGTWSTLLCCLNWCSNVAPIRRVCFAYLSVCLSNCYI